MSPTLALLLPLRVHKQPPISYGSHLLEASVAGAVQDPRERKRQHIMATDHPDRPTSPSGSDDELPVYVHACSRLGRQANPPRMSVRLWGRGRWGRR